MQNQLSNILVKDLRLDSKLVTHYQLSVYLSSNIYLKSQTSSDTELSIEFDKYYNKSQTSSDTELSIEFDKYISKKGGNPGEVIYRLSSDKECINQRILNDNVYVCENATDLELCKTKIVEISFEDVFDNWTSFGNYKYNDKIVQYPTDSDYPVYKSDIGINHWIQSSDKKHIFQTVNTVDCCGYISKEYVQNYDAIISCSSSDADDDLIGFIAAVVKDETDRLHTISFIRTPNNTNSERPDVSEKNYHWYCILDGVELFYPTYTTYNQYCLANGELNSKNEDSGGWSTLKGTLIRVKRVGNKFFGYTSLFSKDTEPTIDDLDNELVIDLEQLINDNPSYANILNLFINKKVQFGFCTESQKNATFDVIKFTIPNENMTIINLLDKTVEKYSIYDDDFKPLIGANIDDYYANGTFSYNSITNKMFYSFGIDYRIINITTSNKINDDTYDISSFEKLTNTMYKLLVILGVSPENIITT